MKVKEFIEILSSKSTPDDELYFVTGAYDIEFIFDKVEVEDKLDDDVGEVSVYVQMEEKENRKEYINCLTEDILDKLKEDLSDVLSRY